ARPPRASTLVPYTTLFRSGQYTPGASKTLNSSSVVAWLQKQWQRQCIKSSPIRASGRQHLDKWQRNRLALTTRLVTGSFKLSPRSEEHTSELQSRIDLVCR